MPSEGSGRGNARRERDRKKRKKLVTVKKAGDSPRILPSFPRLWMSCACACVCPCLIFIRHSYRGAHPKRGKSQTPRKINSSVGTLFKQRHTHPLSLFPSVARPDSLSWSGLPGFEYLTYTLDNPLFFILGVCFSSYNSPVLLL